MASKSSKKMRKKNKRTVQQKKNKAQTQQQKATKTTTCKDCNERIIVPETCIHGCKRVNCLEKQCHRAYLDRHSKICTTKLAEATDQVLEVLEKVENILGRPTRTICGIPRDDLSTKLKDLGPEALKEIRQLLEDHGTKHDIRIFEDFDFCGTSQCGDPLRSSLDPSLPETPSASA